jgi:osmotically inducible protein OsmC
MMDRKASVIWKGSLREGTGTMSTESGVLSDTQYSFRTRFAEGRGTNPDELIAASLSGCFSMALSNELGLLGFHPQRIETRATATPSAGSSEHDQMVVNGAVNCGGGDGAVERDEPTVT